MIKLADMQLLAYIFLQLCLFSFSKLGWFAHPIFSATGGYPPVMIEQINRNSIEEGRSRSRLPEMSTYWKNKIKGSADFLGLNYYTSRIVELRQKPTGPNPSWERDSRIEEIIHPDWTGSQSKWLFSVPSGLGDLLR